MATPTFNGHVDYFGMEAQGSAKFKLTSSTENHTLENANGRNTEGDVVVVDAYNEDAQPQAVYEVGEDIDEDDLPTPGEIIAAADSHITIGSSSVPVCVGGVSIATSTGARPTVTVQGRAVQAGATQIRSYEFPALSLTKRTRAQDFLGLCSIKKGSSAASAVEDYALNSCNANFPIEILVAQPQGATVGYDVQGGMITVDYEMNWYSGTAPTVELTSAATALGATMTTPASKSSAQNGYVTYAWQVSIPWQGSDVTPSSGT